MSAFKGPLFHSLATGERSRILMRRLMRESPGPRWHREGEQSADVTHETTQMRQM